jgi:hypothetical protein
MFDQQSGLIGAWTLLTCDTEYQDTGAREPYFGAVPPKGYLILTSQGRMTALLVGGDRAPGETDKEQATLFRTMIAYAGRYRFDGNRFITTVDVSWNEAWTATEQVRFYTLHGDRLDIVTAWLPHPTDSQHRIMRAALAFERTQ